MTQYYYTNSASVAQASGGISSSAPAVTLSNFSGFPTSYPFWAIIDRGTPKAEVVIVTSVAGSVASITRGQDGLLASDHNAGATFEHIIPASLANRAEAHMEATSGVHGVSGSFVGTTGAQTIVGKSYRGGYRHLYSEDVSALAAAFEVEATTALARDGFKHTNTGGDDARRGFLLTQSGTDRFEAFNDGSVRVTPNSGSTRPGVESRATSAKSALRVGNASAGNANAFNVNGNGDTAVGGTLGVTGVLSTTTNATIGGTLGVTGLSTLAGVNAGATSVTTLGTSGAATLGNSLDVAGVTNLVGQVALTLPAAGTATRLTVNSRTGGNNWEGKNQAATTTSTIKGDGEIVTVGKLFVHNGANPVVAQGSNTADVPSPVASQLWFNSTDKLWYQWSGSAWVVQGGLNNSSSGQVEYERLTTQSIPNAGSGTKVNFASSVQTDTNMVTVSGGTDFTLVRAGTYMIRYNLPYDLSGGAGRRWAWLSPAGTPATRYSAINCAPAGVDATHMQGFLVKRFAAATVLSVYAYQDSGGAINLVPTAAGGSGPCCIEIRWMGP